MALTILLAKVFGTYLILTGLTVLLRRNLILSAVGEFVEDKGLRLVTAALTVLGGLFVIHTHTDWSTLPAALVSLFGWIIVVKGAALMLLPDTKVNGIVRFFNNRTWFTIDGVIALVIGLYLVNFGFSIF